MVSILLGSVALPSPESTYPKHETFLCNKWHLEGFDLGLCCFSQVHTNSSPTASIEDQQRYCFRENVFILASGVTNGLIAGREKGVMEEDLHIGIILSFWLTPQKGLIRLSPQGETKAPY